jgi:hypothetical protein
MHSVPSLQVSVKHYREVLKAGPDVNAYGELAKAYINLGHVGPCQMLPQHSIPLAREVLKFDRLGWVGWRGQSNERKPTLVALVNCSQEGYVWRKPGVKWEIDPSRVAAARALTRTRKSWVSLGDGRRYSYNLGIVPPMLGVVVEFCARCGSESPVMA